jgi:hypothetical protein
MVRDVSEEAVVVTRELCVADWSSALERFGRQHRAWLATIHIVDRETGVARFVGLPVRSAALLVDAIRFEFVDRQSVLCVRHPRALRLQQTGGGAVEALEIDTLGGRFVRLAFRTTASPELLDGIAPGELASAPRLAERAVVARRAVPGGGS